MLQFNHLFQLIEPYLCKTSIRPSLPPELRFCCVLNAIKNAWFYTIGKSTFYKIVPEVCEIICTKIGPLFLHPPSTSDLKRIADEYKENFDFPHCVGALDGRHCPIRQPPHSGAEFYNYKKFYSIVLTAMCDEHKRFTFLNLGSFGSWNDASIFHYSDIRQNLKNNVINLPRVEELPNSDTILPYVIITDGGYPTKNYLMKPYMKIPQMTVPMKVFNFRLSRARYIIEAAFGLLCNLWQVNEIPLGWKLSITEAIIFSTLCLHNAKITLDLHESRGYYDHCIDSAQVNEQQIEEENDDQARYNFNEFNVRAILQDYFVSPAGAVPYQWHNI
ncbi:hypothetical protein TKK_0012246 [Trichogramma kaykai]